MPQFFNCFSAYFFPGPSLCWYFYKCWSTEEYFYQIIERLQWWFQSNTKWLPPYFILDANNCTWLDLLVRTLQKINFVVKKQETKGVFLHPNMWAAICRDKICVCVYDAHPLAGRDIQYRAPDSRSRPVNNLLSTCVLLPKDFYNTLGILLTIPSEYYLQYIVYFKLISFKLIQNSM